MSSQGVSGTLLKANHWILSNCTDDCLPYCWKPRLENVVTLGSLKRPEAQTEDQCKEICGSDRMCDGVDWNERFRECWFLFRHRRTLDRIQHWEIVRNTPTKCSKNEEQCMPHCWTKTVSRKLSFDDGVFKEGVGSENSCKDLCACNQTCIGVYWGFNPALKIYICWLQMPFDVGISGSLTNVNYWSLSNCTDSCLSYCWLPKWEYIQVLDGTLKSDIDDESLCKVACVNDQSCTGIDFNRTKKSCWHTYNADLTRRPTTDPVHHWEIERNFPVTCSNESFISAETTTAEDTTIEASTAEVTNIEATTAEAITAEATTFEATTAEATISESSTVEVTTGKVTTGEATNAEATTSENTNVEVTTGKFNETEKCKPRCWNKTLSEDISFKDGLYRKEIDNEQACKDVCSSNETCMGVYWGFSLSKNILCCYLQVSSQGVSDSLDNANHWQFSNCTDDCLTFCWEPMMDNVQTMGGLYESNAQTEGQCKSGCANDELCDGVDWSDSQQACWFIFVHRRTHQPIQHWEIIRNLPINCSEKDEQCTPHCWRKSESQEISFSDGVSKEGIDNEGNCKDICASNQTCVGVYWGFNPALNIISCWLQMPFTAVSASLTTVSHWKLSDCSDDCLPYCWLPKWEFIHTLGGVLQYGVDDENWCKVTCTYDQKCKGIDFNRADNTCYLLDQIQLIRTPTSEAVHHWEIERNLPMICSNEPSFLGALQGTAETMNDENNTAGAKNKFSYAGHKTVSPVANRTKPKTPSRAHGSGPEVGEVILGDLTPTAAGRAKGKKRHHCPPYYLGGIVVLAALMGVSVVIIIILICLLISRVPREENKEL